MGSSVRQITSGRGDVMRRNTATDEMTQVYGQ
jgi:hypothetical protein